jgi:lipopolysaccharide transport system permease protein
VRFPAEVLPISTVLSNVINFIFATPSILIVMAVTRTPLHPQIALYPVVIVCLFCFSLGIAFMAAATNVFFRDTRNFLDVVISLWFFLTPIIYWDAPSFVLRTLFASITVMLAGWFFFLKLSDRFVEEL